MKSTVKIPVEEHEKLKAENARLKEQLAWYQRQVFGQKSERLTDMPGDTPDIPGLEIPSDESATPETVEVPSHKRKKKSGKGEFKIDLPDWMERKMSVFFPMAASLTGLMKNVSRSLLTGEPSIMPRYLLKVSGHFQVKKRSHRCRNRCPMIWPMEAST